MADFDVVVVGSGAAGGMAVKQLTEAGLRVLMLEAGPDRSSDEELPASGASDGSSRSGFSPADKISRFAEIARGKLVDVGSALLAKPDLQRMVHLRAAQKHVVPGSERQPVQSQCPPFNQKTGVLYVDDFDNPYTNPAAAPFAWIRGRQLGGRTHTWKRMTPRMKDDDFKAPERDGVGEPWPIDEATMRPFYEVAERTLRVVGSVDAGAPDYEGALRAREMTKAESHIRNSLLKRWPELEVSLSPYASPFGPDEDDTDLDGRVDFYDQGKHPAHDCSVRCSIPFARATGKLEIRTGAVVRNVLLDSKTGQASGVCYVDDETKETREVRAKVVMLCASSLESTRILLNSTSSEWPEGLANSSGVLGRYLSDHLFGVGVVGVKPTGGQYESFPPLLLQSFRNGRSDSAKHGFLRGYQIAGSFGALQAGVLRRWAPTLILSAHGEVIPRFENRVTIDTQVVDAWGIPVLRIEYTRGENEAAMCADMLSMSEAMLDAAGYELMMRSPEPLEPGASIHEGGTARMGSSPQNSVLNSHCQTWDISNLYVADAAAFTTAGCQNPLLTIMALSARASAHVVEQFKSGTI